MNRSYMEPEEPPGGTSTNDPTKFFPLHKIGGYKTAIDILQWAEYDEGDKPRTVLEIELCKFSNAIRDRRLWWEKVNDETIVRKWREEAGGVENEEKFNYALAECRWQAENYKGPARPAAADYVFAVDDVPNTLLQRILEGIERIRENSARDVHPGSDGLVVDIIHPSLYAFEQGVTPVLGDATVFHMPPWNTFVMNKMAKPEDKIDLLGRHQMCSEFGLQWLPAEFFVERKDDSDELCCKINSYINSLHPGTHSVMYEVIGDAFIQCLPLLEQVVGELGEPGRPRERPRRIDDSYQWRGDYVPHRDDELPDEYWSRCDLILPEVPKEFDPPPIPDKTSLVEKHLQVIVKIASIELTPDQPAYSGGSWHVEGMRNERIVATACMYIECDNCTDCRLEFRIACGEPQYGQGDKAGVMAMYGLGNEELLVQPRGICRTLKGRILAWPNTLQHRVCPFELKYRTKSGRRTIVCFFLVDPSLRIRSTATVPPQCREWQEVAMEKLLLNKVPTEVAAQITAKLDGLSYEQACERRIRLMNERKQVTENEDGNGKFFERPFSLCEH